MSDFLNSIIPIRRKWLRQLVKLKLTAPQTAIMYCVFDYTYGWNDDKRETKGFKGRKTEAFITFKDLREYTMINKQSNLKRELNKLVECKVIQVLKSDKIGALLAPNTRFQDHVLKSEYPTQVLKSESLSTQIRVDEVLKSEYVNPENPDGSISNSILKEIGKEKKENTYISKISQALKTRIQAVEYQAPINESSWAFYIEQALTNYDYELVLEAINWWSPKEKYKNTRWIRGINLDFDKLLGSYQSQKAISNDVADLELFKVNTERQGGEF